MLLVLASCLYAGVPGLQGTDVLDTYHSLLWYRSGFNPEIKYDYVTKNIVESFNNWIKDINDLPV
jgi:hypothetical protein